MNSRQDTEQIARNTECWILRVPTRTQGW